MCYKTVYWYLFVCSADRLVDEQIRYVVPCLYSHSLSHFLINLNCLFK